MPRRNWPEPDIGAQRHVDDVADPGLARRAGAGIKRILVRRGVEQAAVALEGRLRAVAVMDVEIDDRDPGEPVHLARPQRADRGIVEQAKPHRPFGLGMMAGRADGAERVVAPLSPTTASTAATTAPAARNAALPEAGDSTVSASIPTWPDLGTAASMRSTCRRG